MKRKGKDPFKNRAYPLFIYNLGELKNSPSYNTIKEKLRQRDPFDGDIIEMLPLTNFGKIFRSHFVDIKGDEAHKDVIRDNYKIYYYDTGLEDNFIHLTISGRQAIEEIMKLGGIHNWAVMVLDRMGLIHLDSIASHGYLSLDEFFGDR